VESVDKRSSQRTASHFIRCADQSSSLTKTGCVTVCGLNREKARTGRPCDSAGFVEEAEKLTGRQLAPRSAGHPRKKKK